MWLRKFEPPLLWLWPIATLGFLTLLSAIGAALGIVGAQIVARLMAGLLYGVSPGDPLIFIGVTAVLMVVALAA